MFTDLGLWDEAKQFAADSGRTDLKELMMKNAKWSEEVGDYKSAATMYQACGNYVKAFTLYGERGMLVELMEVRSGGECASVVASCREGVLASTLNLSSTPLSCPAL